MNKKKKINQIISIYKPIRTQSDEEVQQDVEENKKINTFYHNDNDNKLRKSQTLFQYNTGAQMVQQQDDMHQLFNYKGKKFPKLPIADYQQFSSPTSKIMRQRMHSDKLNNLDYNMAQLSAKSPVSDKKIQQINSNIIQYPIVEPKLVLPKIDWANSRVENNNSTIPGSELQKKQQYLKNEQQPQNTNQQQNQMFSTLMRKIIFQDIKQKKIVQPVLQEFRKSHQDLDQLESKKEQQKLIKQQIKNKSISDNNIQVSEDIESPQPAQINAYYTNRKQKQKQKIEQFLGQHKAPISPAINAQKFTFQNEQKTSEKQKIEDLNNKLIQFFQKKMIGQPTIQGKDIKYQSFSEAGQLSSSKKKINQDNYLTQENVIGNKKYYLFGVMDGHGEYGHYISKHVKTSLPNLLQNQITNIQKTETLTLHEITQCFVDIFNKIQSELITSDINCKYSGTTAVATLLLDNKLYCANCGDSRAIVGKLVQNQWQYYCLSIDHKPTLLKEQTRIHRVGGKIAKTKNDYGQEVGPMRVWNNSFSGPGLAMTRSLGDIMGGEAGIIQEPDVIQYNLTDNDKFMIIASDGIWEYLSNNQVIQIIAPYCQQNNIQEAGQALLSESRQAWSLKQEEVIDDMTCVIVFFNNTDGKGKSNQQSNQWQLQQYYIQQFILF